MATRGTSRHGGSGRRPTSQGRKTEWIDTLVSGVVSSAGQVRDSLLSDYISNELAGWTLTRQLVHIWYATDSTQGSFLKAGIDVGVGLVTQEAFAAGIVPDPGTEGDRPVLDWVWRDRLMIMSNTDVTVRMPQIELRLDIRSKRKIGDGELLLIHDNTAINSGFQVRLHGIVRSLFLLP